MTQSCRLATVHPVGVETDKLKPLNVTSARRVSRWVSTGGSTKRLFRFYAIRTPHDSKRLNGRRGREHRPILTLIASRAACLRATAEDAEDMGGRPLPHRWNRSPQGALGQSHWMTDLGEVGSQNVGSTLGDAIAAVSTIP